MTLLREPLVHFLVIGLLVWGARSVLEARVVRVDDDRVEALSASFQVQHQRAPTEEELEGLVEDWIDDELRYREGLALGLERGDPIVRRRVIQSVELLDRAGEPEAEPLQVERLVVGMDQRFDGPWPHGDSFAPRPVEDYSQLFGADFTQALRDAPVGRWIELESVYGLHQVRVDVKESRLIEDDGVLAARTGQLDAAAAERRRGAWVWR